MTVNPDAILRSSKLGNTLVLEWTEAQALGGKKSHQVIKYSRITAEDLIQSLGWRKDDCKTLDLVVIIPEAALKSYSDYLESKKLEGCLLKFDTLDIHLERKLGKFKVTPTDQFFDKAIRFAEIPLGYLPFSLEQISPAGVWDSVSQAIVSFGVRGQLEPTIEQLCIESIPSWNIIAAEKKKLIMKQVVAAIQNIRRKQTGRWIVPNLRDNSIVLNASLFAKRANLKRVRAYLEKEYSSADSNPVDPQLLLGLDD